MILGIDSSGPVAGVALVNAGTLLGELGLNRAQGHCEGLIPAVDRLLISTGIGRNEIEAIAVAIGPGSFTGLRVGIGTARGFALGLGVPNVSVPTVEALAYPYRGESGRVAVVLPSRRDHVFTAVLEGISPANLERPQRLLPESNLPIDGFLSGIEAPILLIGPGLERLLPDLEAGAVPGARWDTKSIHRSGAPGVAMIGSVRFDAGETVPPDDLLPFYVHDEVAKPPRRPRKSQPQ